MSEIKPCPFCKNTELTVSFSHECGRWDVYTVECGACCVSKDSALGFEGDAARQAAIDAWNKRPTEADLTASLNRASDACASVQKERDELRETLFELRRNNRAGVSGAQARKTWAKVNTFLARHEGGPT
jgi:Lar family restriction alleviation protein